MLARLKQALAATVLLVVAACSGGGGSTAPAAVTALTLEPDHATLAEGTAQTFAATAWYADGSTADVSDQVAWTTLHPGVAALGGTPGRVISVAVGSTSVVATHPDGPSATAPVDVSAAELVSIAVTPTMPALAAGTSVQLVATGTFTNGSTQDLTDSVTWSSSHAAVSVSNAPGSEGLCSGDAVGGATLRAIDAASGIEGATGLTVTAAELVSIGVTPSASKVPKGLTLQLTATGTFTDGTTQDLTGSVTWSSTNVAAAQVSNAAGTKGKLSTIYVGNTQVRATHAASGVVGATTVGVTAAALVSIDVTPNAPSIALGTQQALTAMGTFTDGSTQDLTAIVLWSSSASAVATVASGGVNAGLSTSQALGLTTITATEVSSGISDGVALTVTAALLVSIDLSPLAPTIALGLTTPFTATGTYTDASVQDLTEIVTWSSSSIGVATISNAGGSKGLVTSLALGLTTITALDPTSGVSAGTSLGVSVAELLSIAVTPPVTSIALGFLQSFTATGTYTDSSVQDLTESVTWSSSDALVAIVSNVLGSKGLATTLGLGSTTISALDAASGVSGGTTLGVSTATLVSIAVTPALPSIAVGSQQAFTATGLYSDLSTQDLTTEVTWSSSFPGVATISNAGGSKGIATGAGIGLTTITATHVASGVSGLAVMTVTPSVLLSIAVTPVLPTVSVGAQKAFVATGLYSDLSTQDLTDVVTWSSSFPGVATISNAGGSKGIATGVSAGLTTITATHAASGLSGIGTLTVSSALLLTITVTPATPAIALGTQQAFTATGLYSDLSTQDLTSSVTWGSSAIGVATISNAGGSKGVASSVGTGLTFVTAIHVGSGISGVATLTVTPAVLASISVTPAAPSIAVGTQQAFAATGTYTDASTQDLTTAVTWSSSDTGVATVSNAGGSKGLASSIAPGPTTITATHVASGVSGVAALTVTSATLVSVAVTPAASSIALGTQQAFTATGTYSDASTQDLTDAVTWTSSSPLVATVSNAGGSKGLASSVALGSTTVTALHVASGTSGNTTLDVTAAVLVSIAVTPAAAKITVGGTLAYTATGTYSDASTLDLSTAVTWSSTNTGAITILNSGGSEGLASGVAAGSSTIAALHVASGVSGSTGAQAVDPISLRASSTGSSGALIGFLSLPKPTGTVSGDTMLAAIAIRPSTAVVVAPLGWSLVRRTNNLSSSSNSLLVYERTAGGSEPASYTFTLTLSSGAAGGIATFANVDTSSPIVAEDGTSTPSALTHTAPSIVPGVTDTMLVTVHGFSSSANWTPPAGMAEAFEEASESVPSATGVSIEFAYALHAGAGATGTKTATASGNTDVGNAGSIALRRAP